VRPPLDFVPISLAPYSRVLQLRLTKGLLPRGQHRLLALHRAREDTRPRVQVGGHLRSARRDQVVELFVTINAKHTSSTLHISFRCPAARLYPDPSLAVSHDIVRTLNEDANSALHGEIKLFGVGHGRVAQAPLAES